MFHPHTERPTARHRRLRGMMLPAQKCTPATVQLSYAGPTCITRSPSGSLRRARNGLHDEKRLSWAGGHGMVWVVRSGVDSPGYSNYPVFLLVSTGSRIRRGKVEVIMSVVRGGCGLRGEAWRTSPESAASELCVVNRTI